MASIKVTISNVLLPIFEETSKKLMEFLQPITDFIKQNPKFVAAILSITAVLGTLIGGSSVIKNITGALGPLAQVISGLGVGIGELSIPIIAAVAGIGMLAAALSLSGYKC